MSEETTTPFQWAQDVFKSSPDAWNDINQATAPMSVDQIDLANATALEQFDKKRLFLSLFTTPEGSQFLDYLREETVEKPAFTPGVADSAAMGYTREGQNSIYRWIRDWMDQALHDPPKLIPYPSTGEQTDE